MTGLFCPLWTLATVASGHTCTCTLVIWPMSIQQTDQQTMSLRVENRYSDPAGGLRAVTPNDNADLPDGPAHFLFVGGAGNISLVAANDSTASPVTLTGVTA